MCCWLCVAGCVLWCVVVRCGTLWCVVLLCCGVVVCCVVCCNVCCVMCCVVSCVVRFVVRCVVRCVMRGPVVRGISRQRSSFRETCVNVTCKLQVVLQPLRPYQGGGNEDMVARTTKEHSEAPDDKKNPSWQRSWQLRTPPP